MTKQLSRMLWPALAVAALALPPSAAQAADVRVRVPFGFTVKGKDLPAGTYTVSDERSMLTFQGDTSGAIVAYSRVSEPDTRPRLVFERYGDQYFLRQVWTGTGGREVARSLAEQDLAQKARQGKIAKAERVEIPVL